MFSADPPGFQRRSSAVSYVCLNTRKSSTSAMSWYLIVKFSPVSRPSAPIRASFRQQSLGGRISYLMPITLTSSWAYKENSKHLSISQPDKYHCTVKMKPAGPSSNATAHTAICPAGWSLVWDSSWFTTAPSNKPHNHSKFFPIRYSLKMLNRSRDSKIGTMTRPWPWQFGVLIPGSSKNILHKRPTSYSECTGSSFFRFKQRRRETDYSPPSRATVNNEYSCNSTPLYALWHGQQQH